MPAIIGPEVMKHDAIAGSATALRSLKAGLKPRLIDCIMAAEDGSLLGHRGNGRGSPSSSSAHSLQQRGLLLQEGE